MSRSTEPRVKEWILLAQSRANLANNKDNTDDLGNRFVLEMKLLYYSLCP